jgi:hypothetical protein
MIYYYTTTPFDVSIWYTTTTLQHVMIKCCNDVVVYHIDITCCNGVVVYHIHITCCNGVVVYHIETSNVVMVITTCDVSIWYTTTPLQHVMSLYDILLHHYNMWCLYDILLHHYNIWCLYMIYYYIDITCCSGVVVYHTETSNVVIV